MSTIKGLLSQSRQIKSSESYKDKNLLDGLQGVREMAVDVHNSAVAEGTTTLQEDLNILRVQINEMVGKTNWFDKTSISLEELSTIGFKTIIQPIQVATAIAVTAGKGDITTITSGAGAAANGTGVGYLFDTAATATVNTKARVLLRSKETNMPLVDSDESSIYGILEFDGAEGDVVTGLTGGLLSIATYKDVDGVSTSVAYNGNVEAIIPQRVKFSETNEDFAMINAGFAGAIGSIELGDRMWVALNPTTGLYDLTSESGDNADLGITKNDGLTKAINSLIAKASSGEDVATGSANTLGVTFGLDGLVDTDFATIWDGAGINTSYINQGAGDLTILDALKKLDNNLKRVELIADTATGNVEVAILAAPLAAGVAYTLPNGLVTVVGDKDALVVHVNGQLLASDFQISGTDGNLSGDYSVTSISSVTFNFDLIAGDVISVNSLKEI